MCRNQEEKVPSRDGSLAKVLRQELGQQRNSREGSVAGAK